jgi:hypothetical protein
VVLARESASHASPEYAASTNSRSGRTPVLSRPAQGGQLPKLAASSSTQLRKAAIFSLFAVAGGHTMKKPWGFEPKGRQTA